MVGRRSPPASSVSGVGAGGAAKQMLVRRSKSSAILPLRKHLIEKTLAEQQQKAVAAQAAAAAAAVANISASSGSFNNLSEDNSSAVAAGVAGKSALSIRPIEEVMEEDSFSRSGSMHGSMTNIMSPHQECNAMEVDSVAEHHSPQQQV